MIKSAIQKIINFFKSGSDRAVISICLVLSTIFWFLIKFSQEYTYYIDYPISYVNYPIDKYAKEEPIEELKVQVKAFGFKFLKQSFSGRDIELDLSKLRKASSKDTYYWLSNSEWTNVTEDLKGFSVLDIEPDTVFFKFSHKVKRIVPIRVPLDISYAENYVPYRALKIDPAEIEVFGPSHILDTLTILSTDVLIASELKSSIQKQLPIFFPHDLLSSTIKQVEVMQEVARFTEMTITVPIKIKNLPRGKRLKLMDKTVQLSYWVVMQDRDKVKASDFSVYCDYNEVMITNKAFLNVFVEKEPSIVKSVRLTPETVEFIRIN